MVPVPFLPRCCFNEASIISISHPPDRAGRPILAASIRKHLRWTIVTGAGFLVTAAAAIPFFKGNALHDYWNRAGQYLALLCLLFFIVLVFEAGLTWVLWSAKRYRQD
jgi:hypothetical protein